MRNRIKTELLSSLSAELGTLSTECIIESLRREGIITDGGLERAFIRRRVEQLARRGMGRTAAVEQTADETGCSYAKVKVVVYDRRW